MPHVRPAGRIPGRRRLKKPEPRLQQLRQPGAILTEPSGIWHTEPPHWFQVAWHCHRIADRSFAWRGRQMWVCARCLGVILGASLGFLSLMAILVLQGRDAIMSPWTWAIGMAGAGSCILDWSLQTWAHLPSTNMRRLITGLWGGFGTVSAFLAFFGVVVH
ncbi:MAG: DUF2085 domain-containing protein [Halobacteriales archaeon]|nr:DUF2085 domain-containing protein [Halobacteriales archaeon]